MKIKKLVVASFLLATIIWFNILSYFFSGSLADLFGMGVMIFLSILLGTLYIIVQKRFDSKLLKLALYIVFLVTLLIIHLFFHFSSPQPYSAIWKTYNYLKSYDKVTYYNIYEDTDEILKAIALYKFQNVLPEKGYQIYFGIPHPTELCLGCSDEIKFFIECNGKICNSNYEGLVIKNTNDSIFFKATYKGETVDFYYINKKLIADFEIGKEPYIAAFELEKTNHSPYIDFLNDYLEKKKFRKTKI